MAVQTGAAFNDIAGVLALHSPTPTDDCKVTAWRTLPASSKRSTSSMLAVCHRPSPPRSAVVAELITGALVGIQAVAYVPPKAGGLAWRAAGTGSASI